MTRKACWLILNLALTGFGDWSIQLCVSTYVHPLYPFNPQQFIGLSGAYGIFEVVQCNDFVLLAASPDTMAVSGSLQFSHGLGICKLYVVCGHSHQFKVHNISLIDFISINCIFIFHFLMYLYKF